MDEHDRGYWPSRWPAEDGGPRRQQVPWDGQGLGLRPGERLVATSRDALAATMVVLRAPGEAFLLRHTAGDAAVSWVERFDPVTLEVLGRSLDLPGGPTWPGGLAAHADGSLHVVFGRHAHRLTVDLQVRASTELPRLRPYNSFVVLPDGHLVTKDFPGPRPNTAIVDDGGPSQLLVLDPVSLDVVAACDLPEPSIARLSAAKAEGGAAVYAVADRHLYRAMWDGASLALDEGFVARYRTMEGQTYGWDPVITDDAAWFLDGGSPNHRYIGTFRGQGEATAPLHLVRADLATGEVRLADVCGLPGGAIANPPAVDTSRGIAVGYDSGNGVVTAFDVRDLSVRWSVPLDHASHPLLFPDTGEIVLGNHDATRGVDQVVVLAIETGAELGRVDTASPVQSVLFPCPGFDRDLYVCSFTTLTRVSVA